MPFDYDSITAAGLRQIKDKGKIVSYVSNAKGEYNPTIDELQGVIESSYIISGVFTAVKQSDIDETLIKNGDQILMISGTQSFVPKTNDAVFDGDIKYKIMDVTTIAPGGAAVIYKLLIRR